MDQDTGIMQATPAPSPARSSAIDATCIIGWILGGISLLNLVEDLSPLKLYGLIAKWVAAYQALTRQVGETLFGWIDLKWMRIDGAEFDGLIIALLLFSALTRASKRVQILQGVMPAAAWSGALAGSTAVILLPYLALVILIPGIYGLVAALLYLAYATYEFLFSNPTTDEELPASREVRVELIGATAVFALLVALNYAIFAPKLPPSP